MQYGLLGPLRVVDRDRPCTPTAAKVRVLLAALLVRPNQMVPTERLVEEIWVDHPPRRAEAGVHVYVSQLRKLLATGGEHPIATRPPGYQLDVPDGALDVACFEAQVLRGRRELAAGDFSRAAGTFATALGLWRGPALCDVLVGRGLATVATRLEEARLEAVELRIEADIALGRHLELIGELRALIVEHPFREAFHRQLMLTLYRSERQTDALHAYLGVRRLLNEELGVEPGRPLRRLQKAILVGDRALDLDR